MEEMPAKKAKKRPEVVVAPSESDEAAMARFAREHPQYVQAELEHYWKHDIEAKKKGVKKEDEAGPSTAIPIELLSEEDEEFWGLSDDSEESYWMPSDNE